MKKQKLGLDLLIPFVVAGVFALANLLGFWRGAESRVYDLALHLKPAVPENPALLFLDIDDTAIAKVGTFPWSRDLMADGLLVLREFGAAYAVFDIEYVDPSPRGINAQLLEQEVPELFGREFQTIQQNVRDLFQALRRGMIGLGEAEDYIRQLEELTDSSRQLLLAKVGEIARDNDTYLGRAASLFGKAFFTVNMVPEPEPNVGEELRRYVLDNVALPKVQVAAGFPFVSADIRPAILPVMKGARGAGFPNVIVDGDGVRRRINLVMGYGEHYFAQLGFAALLDWLGRPEVSVEARRIVLKDAELPGKGRRDIVIPLAEDRRFLINWPKKRYQDSFRHLTYWELVRFRRLELELVNNLKIMEEAGYLAEFKSNYGLLDPYRYAQRILEELLAGAGDPQGMEEYRQARATFFQDVGAFLEGQAESDLAGKIDALLASGQLKAKDRPLYLQHKQELPKVFAATREVYKNLAQSRATLQKALEGSFCILGWTGTSTTDIGVNPFEEEYMNVGTHASVVNTILSGRFLDSLPWWISALAALVLAVAVYFLTRRLAPLLSILIGLGFLAAIVVLGLGFFLATGSYLNLLTPVLSVFFTLFALILFKFLVLEKEKSYIRNAFSHYLSTDVINELIADPEKLKLGGEKKLLTAMFTDVRQFSTISETMDPTDLVKLLNAYLTEMSNIILELRGTIDKYEGDAIIAFFGAPLSYADHASRACSAAVRMKKMEKYLNEHFLAEKLSPTPLATRIGINTGEMVVGNMGTAQKMDYTIMGNSVNLASRLEGVNKQYGTWVLASEATHQEAGDAFAWRQMDRVRVVGISQPVRLYELLEEKSALDAPTREAVEIFHRAQALFEGREWDKAAGLFEEVQRLLPGDGPAETFLKRCREFKKKPPAENWDGVFSLAVK
jgi:adenylate cyclase